MAMLGTRISKWARRHRRLAAECAREKEIILKELENARKEAEKAKEKVYYYDRIVSNLKRKLDECKKDYNNAVARAASEERGEGAGRGMPAPDILGAAIARMPAPQLALVLVAFVRAHAASRGRPRDMALAERILDLLGGDRISDTDKATIISACSIVAARTQSGTGTPPDIVEAMTGRTATGERDTMGVDGGTGTKT